MHKTLHHVKKKINSKRGLSLSEVLITILIILLVSSTMTDTIDLASRQYLKSLRYSESKVLGSTLEAILNSELAFTTEIHVDASGNVLSFQSQNYAVEDDYLSTIGERKKAGETYGKIVFANRDNATEYVNILADGAYPNGIGVKVESINYDKDLHDFTVHYKVGYQNSELLDKTFQVHNDNNTEATEE